MKSLQSPRLWLVVFVVAACTTILVIRNRGPSDQKLKDGVEDPVTSAAIKEPDASDWVFQDVVKNPEYWERFSRAQDDLDVKVRAAKGWSSEEVAALTRHFVLEVASSRDAQSEAQILRGLGERTHPAVLALLSDPSLYDQLVKPTGVYHLPEAPLNRACDLLQESPPSSAVEALAPFLNHSSDEIRKDAALVIARTGAASITPHVRKAFADVDEYVRSYTLIGIENALERTALSDAARHELVGDVLALLQEGKNADKAAEILYRLDQEAATEYFLSPEVFTVECQVLHEVLETLGKERVPVPRDRLQGLIASLETREMKYPHTYSLCEALRLLGQQQREEDRDFLRSRMTHSAEEVAEGAAKGLLCSFGLEEFAQLIWDTADRDGIGALSQHQRYYAAALECDGEVRNGGFSQYFVNSSGDHWRDAVAGFKAMGFKEQLGIVQEAIGIFGADGPSPDRNERQKQLSKLYKRNDAIFQELESRYYKSSEAFTVLATRYVIANPYGFR